MKISTPITATLWVKGALDESGKPSYNAPVEFPCRWEDRQQKFQEHTGNERISTAIIYHHDSDLIGIGDIAAKGNMNYLLSRNLTAAQKTTLAGSLGMTVEQFSAALLLPEPILGLDYGANLKPTILAARTIRAKNETVSINGQDNLVKLYCQ